MTVTADPTDRNLTFRTGYSLIARGRVIIVDLGIGLSMNRAVLTNDEMSVS